MVSAATLLWPVLVCLAWVWAVESVVVASVQCLGEFQRCNVTGACVLIPEWCNNCSKGQYLCPLPGTGCVDSAEDYMKCPGLTGTHLDWRLDVESRLDYLVNHTADIYAFTNQLTNDAPSMPSLGIPSYNWLNDDEHQADQHHATSFPNGCALGATWSQETLFEVGTAIGVEARADHNGFVHYGQRGQQNENGVGITMYAPNMNLVRDPRWGRAQEVYSEDPLLSSKLTYNFVTGGQGNGTYMTAAACCKHFAAYDLDSIPIPRVEFSAKVDVRNMWETYLPVFQSCVRDAHAAHVMCSYNSINGVPTCGDPNLLNGILREQWKWPGFVVSDYDAWANIDNTHHYCPNMTCAAAVGINAGMDQEGGGDSAITFLPAAVKAGLVDMQTVVNSYRRLFRVRILLGMLDPPTLVQANLLNNNTDVENAAHLALARKAAQQAMCLYKNDDTLPLSTASTHSIALIGPQVPGGQILQGNYAQYPDLGVVSVLQGVTLAYGVNSTNCSYSPGTSLTGAAAGYFDVIYPPECASLCTANSNCTAFVWYGGGCTLLHNVTARSTKSGAVAGECHEQLPAGVAINFSPGCADVQCHQTNQFVEAVEVAKAAQVVIITLGLDLTLENEGHDRSNISLPENQYKLVRALRNATKGKAKLIGVLIHGGTLELRDIPLQVDALVDAWYPGQEGGNGLADVLFGKYNPGGRAAVTYYKNTSQLPAMGDMDLYPHTNSSGITYRYFQGEVEIPFGFGLSYTDFSYGNLRTNATEYSPCDVIGVTVTVKNVGHVDGDEVVQLYAKQPGASVPAPTIRLVDFTRVTVASGQSVEVNLSVTPEFHSVVLDGDDIYRGQRVVEKGILELFVGGGQPQFYPGHLKAQVAITKTANIDVCSGG